MPILIYKDNRKTRFMELSKYNCRNMGLSNPGQEINVSDKEATYLMKLKNGKNNVFELKKPRASKEKKIESAGE